MKLVADESVDKPIVDALRAKGYEVEYIAEFAPSTVDEDVLQLATARHAILVTSDKDFGELVFRRGVLSRGVVLIRLAGLSTTEKAHLVVSAIQNHQAALAGAFSVISPSSIRIRRDVFYDN